MKEEVLGCARESLSKCRVRSEFSVWAQFGTVRVFDWRSVHGRGCETSFHCVETFQNGSESVGHIRGRVRNIRVDSGLVIRRQLKKDSEILYQSCEKKDDNFYCYVLDFHLYEFSRNKMRRW
jgi:hypothetical protein